jgi:hypothetical protein
MTFRAKLSAVYAAVEGWQRPSAGSLRFLGAGLTAAEVTEALQRIAELQQERDRIALDPDLNCDDEDEVHFAQRDIATALQHISPEATDALVAGLRSPCRSVRFWSSIASQHAASSKHLESLQLACASETDAIVKKVLQEAITRLATFQ